MSRQHARRLGSRPRARESEEFAISGEFNAQGTAALKKSLEGGKGDHSITPSSKGDSGLSLDVTRDLSLLPSSSGFSPVTPQ